MDGSVARSVPRSVARSTALGLCAAALLTVGGCNQNGSYRLSWVFVADATTGAKESTSTGCGRFYVDSILATGADDSGDGQQVQALCTAGWVTADVPPGTWSFSVQMLNSQGAVIQSAQPSMMMTSAQPIATDGPQAQFAVSLWPM
jgi:hypothetical protein